MPPRSDDTPARLIQAAGEIFAEKGYEAASIREISARAGANLAAINYHFRDKEGLFTEVVKAAACTPAGEEELQWPPDAPPERKLRDIVRARLSAMLSTALPRWADQVMVRAMAEPTSATLEVVVQSVRPKFEQLFTVLAELLPPRTPPADVHLAGISVIAQCMHFRIQGTITEMIVGPEEYSSFTLDRLADHISRFSLAAVGLADSFLGRAVSETAPTPASAKGRESPLGHSDSKHPHLRRPRR